MRPHRRMYVAQRERHYPGDDSADHDGNGYADVDRNHGGNQRNYGEYDNNHGGKHNNREYDGNHGNDKHDNRECDGNRGGSKHDNREYDNNHGGKHNDDGNDFVPLLKGLREAATGSQSVAAGLAARNIAYPGSVITVPTGGQTATIASPQDGAQVPAGNIRVPVDVGVNKTEQTNVPGEGHLLYSMDVSSIPIEPESPAITPKGNSPPTANTCSHSGTGRNAAPGRGQVAVTE